MLRVVEVERYNTDKCFRFGTRSLRYRTHQRMSMADNGAIVRRLLLVFLLCAIIYTSNSRHMITKRNYSDQSVQGYLAERTCWWNEVCKEEFHSKFRCRCPQWSYCRAPGKYYDAHCSMTTTGYIWTQPEISMAIDAEK